MNNQLNESALTARLLATLAQSPIHAQALVAAAQLGLPQHCLAAGFVRNLAWDLMHDITPPTPLNDIDVVYFDPADCSPERDRQLEKALNDWVSLPWSVKNQARMHLRNGHAPYASTEAAMAHWVECETAVGARLRCAAKGATPDNIELVAPLGVGRLFELTITFNRRAANPAAFVERHHSKGWRERWPRLRLSE